MERTASKTEYLKRQRNKRKIKCLWSLSNFDNAICCVRVFAAHQVNTARDKETALMDYCNVRFLRHPHLFYLVCETTCTGRFLSNWCHRKLAIKIQPRTKSKLGRLHAKPNLVEWANKLVQCIIVEILVRSLKYEPKPVLRQQVSGNKQPLDRMQTTGHFPRGAHSWYDDSLRCDRERSSNAMATVPDAQSRWTSDQLSDDDCPFWVSAAVIW